MFSGLTNFDSSALFFTKHLLTDKNIDVFEAKNIIFLNGCIEREQAK